MIVEPAKAPARIVGWAVVAISCSDTSDATCHISVMHNYRAGSFKYLFVMRDVRIGIIEM